MATTKNQLSSNKIETLNANTSKDACYIMVEM
jgi:hypothetical protein